MPTPLTDQLDANRSDRLRVLIVGAGVAGRTLAALLHRDGMHPIVIDKAPETASPGYMLALMPLVDPAFTDLDITDAYHARSTPIRRFHIRGHTGKLLGRYLMSDMLSGYGQYRGISRSELLDALATNPTPITYEASVTAIDHTGGAAIATITDATSTTTAHVDLIVAADGINSKTRDLVIGPDNVTGLDTGWGGWITWGDPTDGPDAGEELWGRGFFLGTYPVKDRVGIIVCGHRDDTRNGPAAFIRTIGERITTTSPRTTDALTRIRDTTTSYFWPLYDKRSTTWRSKRFILLGDAAAGFLPTAGIGACMAIESAHVLSKHLSAANPRNLHRHLADYERHQRPRVEAAQDNSRTLARLMFNHSRTMAVARDIAARWVPINTALRPIRGLLETPPVTAT